MKVILLITLSLLFVKQQDDTAEILANKAYDAMKASPYQFRKSYQIEESKSITKKRIEKTTTLSQNTDYTLFTFTNDEPGYNQLEVEIYNAKWELVFTNLKDNTRSYDLNFRITHTGVHYIVFKWTTEEFKAGVVLGYDYLFLQPERKYEILFDMNDERRMKFPAKVDKDEILTIYFEYEQEKWEEKFEVKGIEKEELLKRIDKKLKTTHPHMTGHPSFFIGL